MWVGKTLFSSTFLIRYRFQEYRCKSGIVIFAWRIALHYAYSPFSSFVDNSVYSTEKFHRIICLYLLFAYSNCLNIFRIAYNSFNFSFIKYFGIFNKGFIVLFVKSSKQLMMGLFWFYFRNPQCNKYVLTMRYLAQHKKIYLKIW